MITAVVDRFEEDMAVLLLGDEEEQVIFPAAFLPEDIEEGDYLSLDISYDAAATEAARNEAAALLKELQEGD